MILFVHVIFFPQDSFTFTCSFFTGSARGFTFPCDFHTWKNISDIQIYIYKIIIHSKLTFLCLYDIFCCRVGISWNSPPLSPLHKAGQCLHTSGDILSRMISVCQNGDLAHGDTPTLYTHYHIRLHRASLLTALRLQSGRHLTRVLR